MSQQEAPEVGMLESISQLHKYSSQLSQGESVLKGFVAFNKQRAGVDEIFSKKLQKIVNKPLALHPSSTTNNTTKDLSQIMTLISKSDELAINLTSQTISKRKELIEGPLVQMQQTIIQARKQVNHLSELRYERE